MKAKKSTDPSITIRQIEQCQPCSEHYFKFLRYLKSNPVDDNWNVSFRRFKAPAYTPDDPIPLSLIAQHKEQGTFWIDWLCKHDLVPKNLFAAEIKAEVTHVRNQLNGLDAQINALRSQRDEIERASSNSSVLARLLIEKGKKVR